jgi:hypothetical protein
MEVEVSIKKDLNPRVDKLEKTSVTLVKDMTYFRDNIGDDLVAKVKSLEESLNSFEAMAPGNSPEVSALRTVLVKEIMPALRASVKPALRPGLTEAAGEHLINRIHGLETAVNKAGTGGYGATLSIEQRLRVLESVAPTAPAPNQGGIPSLFGQPLGGAAMAPPVPVQVGTIGHGGSGHVSHDLVNRVNTLFSRVKELDAQLGNVTVICGGQSFCSVEDYETFIILMCQVIPMRIFTIWSHSYNVPGVKRTSRYRACGNLSIA